MVTMAVGSPVTQTLTVCFRFKQQAGRLSALFYWNVRWENKSSHCLRPSSDGIIWQSVDFLHTLTVIMCHRCSCCQDAGNGTVFLKVWRRKSQASSYFEILLMEKCKREVTFAKNRLRLERFLILTSSTPLTPFLFAVVVFQINTGEIGQKTFTRV